MAESRLNDVFTSPQCYPLLQELRGIVKQSRFQDSRAREATQNKFSFLNLKTLLHQAPANVIGIASLQVVEPLVIILMQEQQTQNDTVDLLECIETILERSRMEDYNLYYKLIIGSCKLFNQNTKCDGTIIAISEELSAAIFKVLTRIFVDFRNYPHLNEVFLTHKNLPLIAMIVQNTLTYLQLKDEIQAPRLQSMALKLLSSLFRLESNLTKCYKTLAQLIGSLFPGIASALFKIVLNPHRFKSGTVVETLRVLPVFLSLALNAVGEKQSENETKGKGSNSSDEVHESISKLLPESQGDDWLKKVLSNVEKFLRSAENVLPSSSSYKIRSQSLLFAEDLLSTCGCRLNTECLHSLVIIVTELENDEYEEIRSLASSARDRIVESRPEWFISDHFQLKCCQNILEFSSQVPKCSQLQSEESFVALLKKILANLSFIDFKRSKFLRVGDVLQKIFDNFACCFEVEISKIQLMTSCSDNFNRCSDEELAIASVSFNTDDLGIKFKYVSWKHLKLMREILRQFLSGTTIFAIHEVLSDKMHANSNPGSYCYTMLFTLIIESVEIDLTTSEEKEFLHKFVHENLKEVVSPEFLSGPSKVSIIQQLLILQMVQSTCRAIRHQFDVKKLIYDVIILVSHDTSLVAHAAVQTLLCIAKFQACCNSVSQLFEQNYDYVFSDSVLKLKHSQIYPEVVSVLCILLQYTGPKSLLFVKHVTVECHEQLKLVIALAHNRNSKLKEKLLLLCAEVSRYLHRNYYSSEPAQTCLYISEKLHSTGDRARRDWTSFTLQLTSHLTSQNEDLNTADEKNTPIENIENTGNDDDDVIIEKDPVHVQIAHKIINISIYHLYSDHFKSKVYCLSAAENCFLVLSQAKSGNFLLPMIHQIWDAVCARLKDDKPVVVLKACKLILLFSQLSSDFVRRRVVQDCVPMLLQWLETLIGKFMGKTTVTSYEQYTYDYKLLVLLMQNVPQLFANCNIVPWDREITFKLSKAIVHASKPDVMPIELSAIAGASKLSIKKHEPAIVEFLEISFSNV